MAAEQFALTVLMGILLVAVVVLLARLENWRSYTPLGGGGAVGEEESAYAHEEKPGPTNEDEERGPGDELRMPPVGSMDRPGNGSAQRDPDQHRAVHSDRGFLSVD